MKPARAALALWIAASAAACRGAAARDTVRLAQPDELYSLDPDAAADSQSRAILCNLYEALVAFDRDMAVVPALAVSWTTPDERTWEFELRPGVSFHDGRRLTAADVKFSIERVGGLPPKAPDPVARLAEVEVVNDHRVRVRTAGPDPLLLNRLTQLLIVPAGVADPNLLAVGTGPYRVARRSPGRLELEAYAGHWRGRAPIERVVVLAVPHAGVREALGRGEVDLYRPLPATALPQLASLAGFRVIGRPGLTMTYLWFDCSPQREGGTNPFADVRVRRAVSMALDRSEILRRLGGRDVPGYQILPKGVFGFIKGWPPPPLDPGGARRLLKAAGYRDGFEARLHHAGTDPDRVLAAAVRDMLAPIGIRVVLEELSWHRLLEARRDRRLGFFVLGWTFDDGDAWTFLMASLHSRAGPADLRSTNPGYSNPVLDRLIEESGEAPSIEERQLRYGAALRLALEELPVVPLYNRYDLYAVSDRVSFEPRLDGKLVVTEMRLAPGR